jgi:hypothetical protein
MREVNLFLTITPLIALTLNALMKLVEIHWSVFFVPIIISNLSYTSTKLLTSSLKKKVTKG